MSSTPERIPLPLAGHEPASVAETAARPPATAPVQGAAPLSQAQTEEIREKAAAALRTCYDPELPVNILELGLVYRLDVLPSGLVEVDMTLTSPACPVAASLLAEVRSKIRTLPGVAGACVSLVWDPPWTPERMSEAARLVLGLFG